MNIFRTYTDSLASSYGVATYQTQTPKADAVPHKRREKEALFDRLTGAVRGLAGVSPSVRPQH